MWKEGSFIPDRRPIDVSGSTPETGLKLGEWSPLGRFVVGGVVEDMIN